MPGPGGQRCRSTLPLGRPAALGEGPVLDAEGLPQGTGGRRTFIRPHLGRLAARLGAPAPVVRHVESGARLAGSAAGGWGAGLPAKASPIRRTARR
jgi:hypothetical protein